MPCAAVSNTGAVRAFGILAGITGLAFLAIPLLQVVGPAARKFSGHVQYVVPSCTEAFLHDGLPDNSPYDKAAASHHEKI